MLAVTAVLLGGGIACSGDGSSSNDSPEPRERIDYANVEIPEDRADDAVDSALGSIDPCALIDPSGVGVKYLAGGDVEAGSPHKCRVSNGAVEVSVQIGAAFSAEERYNAKPETLGGAKAYVVRTDNLGLCQVALPVDFTHSIMFVGSYSWADNRDACDNAKAFAAAGAKRLDEPDDVAHAKGPANQTACDILRPAVEVTEGTELRSGWDFGTGVDQCGLWEKVSDAGFQPSAPEVGLSVEYRDSIPDYYKPAGTVGGRELRTFECKMSWNERGAHSANGSANVVFSVSAPSCKKAKRAVGDIAEVIDEGRVRKPAEPQRQVLYAPDEPDVAAAGACVDVLDSVATDCRPYQETDAPADGAETIEAASADPNVNCAIAAEAVEVHFGANLRPVTAEHGIGSLDTPARMCGFVEESHATQLWIGVSSEPMSESTETEIAGHPAHDETTASEGERTISVALDDEGESGYLYGEILVRPERADRNLDDPPFDKAPMRKLDEAMTDIAESHFNAE